MLDDLFSRLNHYFTAERLEIAVRVAVIVVGGALVARYGSRGIAKLVGRKGDPQQAQLLRRLSAWGLFMIALAWALDELGFKLGVLLGAAGVLTVAVGFASQTTLSNMISGFYLFGERPFRVGDVVEVEGVTGEVLSVDLMATKIRTFQNHYVRVPNELMLKTKVVNLTRFAIRRVDLLVPIPYEEDLARVQQVLLELAYENPLCLVEPAPLSYVESFAESRLEVRFCVWGQTQSYLALKSSIQADLLRAFRAHGIRIAYPHRIVHPAPGEDGGGA